MYRLISWSTGWTRWRKSVRWRGGRVSSWRTTLRTDQRESRSLSWKGRTKCSRLNYRSYSPSYRCDLPETHIHAHTISHTHCGTYKVRAVQLHSLLREDLSSDSRPVISHPRLQNSVGATLKVMYTTGQSLSVHDLYSWSQPHVPWMVEQEHLWFYSTAVKCFGLYFLNICRNKEI